MNRISTHDRSAARAAGCGALLLSLAACATAPTWRAVDPTRLTVTATGTVHTHRIEPDGSLFVVVSPDEASRHLLAKNQQRLPCMAPPATAEQLAPVAARLAVGQAVTVQGYWTARDERTRSEHWIRDVTSIALP